MRMNPIRKSGFACTAAIIVLAAILTACFGSAENEAADPAGSPSPSPAATSSSAPPSGAASPVASFAPSPEAARLALASEPANRTASPAEASPAAIASPTASGREAVYRAFLKEHGYGSPLRILTGDLDQDGAEEAVCAFGTGPDGNSQPDITKVVVLRNRGGQAVLLDGSIEDGYSIEEVQLVRLQGLPHSYIYSRLSNGGGLNGFRIDEIADGQVRPLVHSASPTGSGTDTILDRNGDGQIDGYQQDRASYDVLYVPQLRQFDLEGNEFVWTHTGVDLPDYPTAIPDVIQQYLTLKALGILHSPETEARLQDLCPSKEASAVDIPYDPWVPLLLDTQLYMDSPLQIQVSGDQKDSATALVTGSGKNKSVRLEFHLRFLDGKWAIDAIH